MEHQHTFLVAVTFTQLGNGDKWNTFYNSFSFKQKPRSETVSPHTDLSLTFTTMSCLPLLGPICAAEVNRPVATVIK